MSQSRWTSAASRSPVLSGVLNGIGTLAQRRQPGGEEARAASNGPGWWEVGVLHCGTVLLSSTWDAIGWPGDGVTRERGVSSKRERAEESQETARVICSDKRGVLGYSIVCIMPQRGSRP